MSDTSQARVQRIREESPIVAAICSQLERQLPPDEASLVVAFAEIFLSKAPPEFLGERSTDALAATVLGAYRFLERSEPGRVDVEVLDPDLDNEGWYAPVTVLRTNVSERPFIVDTLREFLHSQELAIEHFIYPVVHVERREGRIVEVGPAQQGESRESLVHCEITRVTDSSRLRFLRTEAERRLQDVVRSTDDFHPMLDALVGVSSELAEQIGELPARSSELAEIRAFLHWLRDGAFVFLGYRAYDLVTEPVTGEPVLRVESGSGLGILRAGTGSAHAAPVLIDHLDGGAPEYFAEGPMLIIGKTDAESTVHRRARMDHVGIKKLDPSGNVVGEHRFVGLFTSRAYSEQADLIPILREKLQWILEDAGVREGSHDYKEINTIFNSMPKEELFLASAREIAADVRTVLTSYHALGVHVTLREDPLHRGISVLVILPRESFSGQIRRRIEAALVEAYDGQVLNYHLALGSGDQARLHFYLVASRERLGLVQPAELERKVQEIIRSWSDRLREALERHTDPEMARTLSKRFGEAFSAEYQAATDPRDAVHDVLELESMQAEQRPIAIAFVNRKESVAAPGVQNVTELKVYLRGQRLVLSDFMPILENAWLRVIAVSPFEIGGPSVERTVLYTFAVQDPAERPLEVDEVGALLAETILAVWAGDATNDGLNALVVSAGLHWREVDVLRSYAAFAFQRGAVPSRAALPTALIQHPHIARVLFELFEVRFDPDRDGPASDRTPAADDIRALIAEVLRGVTLLADDRALRRLLTLVNATVRTNYYRCGGRVPTRRSGGVPYTSFKFACREIDTAGRSGLLYEVWVRSSRMEGVHLRGAKVSRGGIRWSDRPHDFRKEVLGLVKTQMVKNAVIVPAGSKGGFVTLRTLLDPEGIANEGREQYRTLIRGLLDLTDNLDAQGAPLPPERVVCVDDPDPYLVVAADKGTAKFSDLANEVSAEYGFWLGDAFASGGSQGYDHKQVGITARGAWECVKRHFHELGKDIQSQPFTVVGIGDMSGDVFGNGMLLSNQIRLVAAFDHRHVFIDPDPDPRPSFAERARLFGLGRSSWGDYDQSLLSAGGMIVPRGAKEVELTLEAKRALGLPDDTATLDGEALVRSVLRAPVELLWNGGIGTYVKASDETHSGAGDPSTDAVRIDASELRCEVVGEGGNLGLTQRARIQYALSGGRINTDALDNSGGVDLSDREVNLKILLNQCVQAGTMTLQERNALLFQLTDSVADLVVMDNRSQSLAISLEEIRARSPESTEGFRDFMTSLEKAGVLDRAAEHLPSLEALVERQEQGGGLSRPELCILLAYSKLNLMSEVLRSPLPDDPTAERYLLGYFPGEAVAATGQGALDGHRLRREIIGSQMVNELTDLMGATFVHRMVRSTGYPAGEVVRAWLVAARLVGLGSLLREVEQGHATPPVPEVYRWLIGLGRVLERTSRWMLQNLPREASLADTIAEKLEILTVLRRHFPDVVTGSERLLFHRLVADLQALGAKEGFARSLITLRFLDQLLEIQGVARETQKDPVEVARAFYRISELMDVPWIRQAISDAAESDRWEQRAAQALADDLTRAHHTLAAQVVRTSGEGVEVEAAVDLLLASREREVARFRELMEEIRSEAKMSLAGLSIAVREMGALAEALNGKSFPE